MTYVNPYTASFDEAMASLRLAEVLLAEGNYEVGLAHLRLRNQPAVAKACAWSQTARPVADMPVFDLSSPAQSVLIHAEGGIGDTVQFCRFVQTLAEIKPNLNIAFEVQNPIAALMTRNMADLPNVTVFQRKAAALPFAVDAHLPLLDLQAALGYVTPAAIAKHAHDNQGYLKANPALVAAASDSLDRKYGQDAKFIGLCWRGDPNNTYDVGRDAKPADLQPLFGRGHVVLSVLDDVRPHEHAQMPFLQNLHPKGASFEQVAALMTAMTLQGRGQIVSTDTVWPNLAGAMNLPTQLMLPATANWRWGTVTPRTIWYPNTMLMRQPEAGAWAPVVARVGGLLDTAARPPKKHSYGAFPPAVA